MERTLKLKWLGVMALWLVTITGMAQTVRTDIKTGLMVSANTGAAEVPELLYRQQNDSVKSNTTNILAAVTVRNAMKTMDMQARMNLNGFKRESKNFIRLVNEVHYLLESAALLIKEASKNPHHMVFVTKQTAKLLLECRNLVRYAVVVGMNGKVPNPFKIHPDSLQKDLANTPDYIYDADNDSVVTDDLNLLLPDERMLIVNESRQRLRSIRQAMDKMYYKLLTDFNVRNLIWEANRIDGRLYDTNVYAVEEVKSNLRRLGGLF